jgi:hypothetical protein
MATFWNKFLITLSEYTHLKTHFNQLMQALLNACVQKCRVSVEYLNYYAEDKRTDAEEEDGSD